MDYQTFKKYQLTVDKGKLRLDNLNPYALVTTFPASSNVGLNKQDVNKGYYLKQATGVREILVELFNYFSSIGYFLNIPEDVYPEYFNLVPQNARISSYSSCLRKKLFFDSTNPSLALVANPLIPEGRYLSIPELKDLDQWLIEDSSRWLLFDTVYDYKFYSLNFEFTSSHVIFISSLSKINLNPRKQGWALCKTKLPGFELNNSVTIDYAQARSIQKSFNQAWQSINEKFNIRQIHGWEPSEVGYLSMINLDYKELLECFDVAAIPASIFGIRNTKFSVISCLSEI